MCVRVCVYMCVREKESCGTTPPHLRHTSESVGSTGPRCDSLSSAGGAGGAQREPRRQKQQDVLSGTELTDAERAYDSLSLRATVERANCHKTNFILSVQNSHTTCTLY